MTPNRICLIVTGRHEEYKALADVYPGMLVLPSGTVMAPTGIPHNLSGGAASPVIVAVENAWAGGGINTSVPSGYVFPAHVAKPGDVLLLQLQAGQSITVDDSLMSAGDGSVMKNPSPALFQITAPSSNISAIAAETAFSNGNATIPASLLRVGDTIRVRGRAAVLGQNSSDLHTLKLYLDSTVLENSGARNLAANSSFVFGYDLTVTATGNSGGVTGTGTMSYGANAANGTSETFFLQNTTFNTTSLNYLSVAALQSANSTGNIIQLQDYQVSLNRQSGLITLFRAQETIDNSSSNGTAKSGNAWIRAIVV